MATPAPKSHQRRLVRCGASAAPSPIDQLALALAEVQHDLREFGKRLDALTAPQRPPPGFVALKLAASLAGYSIETMRLRAVHREVKARRIGGKWFVKLRGKLEDSKPSGRGKVAA
jgi:hypothetical protein